MSAKTTLEPQRQRAHYVTWRGEELAKLALSRIPDWTVIDTTPDGQFDFAVMDIDNATMFMVDVTAFSSIHSTRKIDLSSVELPYSIPVALVKSAKAKGCPVLLFVFDADTGHGRFRRLDTLDIHDVTGDKVWVGLPIANTINAESMKRLAKKLSNGS